MKSTHYAGNLEADLARDAGHPNAPVLEAIGLYIGFGRAQQILQTLWANHLKSKGLPTSGALVPEPPIADAVPAMREDAMPISIGDFVKYPHGVGEVFKAKDIWNNWWVRHTDGLERWYAHHNLKKLLEVSSESQKQVEGAEQCDTCETITARLDGDQCAKWCCHCGAKLTGNYVAATTPSREAPDAWHGWRDVGVHGYPDSPQAVLMVCGGIVKWGAFLGDSFWYANCRAVAAQWMPIPTPLNPEAVHALLAKNGANQP